MGMERFDPTREIELSVRSVHALDGEQGAPQLELFRRVVEARKQARRRNLDLLFARIDSALRSA